MTGECSLHVAAVCIVLIAFSAPLARAATAASAADGDVGRRLLVDDAAAAAASAAADGAAADEAVVSTIRQLSTALNKCGLDGRHLSQMRRVMLTGEAKCMDGSPAGYYIRRSPGSRKWLVFLEGGSYCFDNATCNARVSNSPNLTGSARWTSFREGNGILSRDAEENPFLFFANVVFVPYCSSDAWTGTSTKGNHIFMGSVIIDEVMVDLLNHGLREANKLFVTGSSAGATGVLLNIDRVTAMLAERAPGVNVLGIVDSGWFVDVPPYTTMRCTSMLNCAPVDSIKRGYRYWRARVPRACEQEYPDKQWNCFFGYRLYPFIKTPVFIIQYLYDTAQIGANLGYGGLGLASVPMNDGGPGVARDDHEQDRQRYMNGLAQKTNRTLHGVSAVFAPSCMSHEILLKNIWYKLAINGISLHEALQCWEESQQATNRVRPSSSDTPGGGRIATPDRRSPPTRSSNGNNSGNLATNNRSSNLPRHSTRRAGRTMRPTVSNNNRLPRDARQRGGASSSTDGSPALRDMAAALRIHAGGGGGGSGGAVSSDSEMLALTNQLIEYREQKQAQCSHRLLDSCETPYCNFKCPNYLALFGGGGGGGQSDGGSPASTARGGHSQHPSHLGAAAAVAPSVARDFFANNR